MTPRSISRRLIAGVLLLELISALALIGLTAMHESQVRFRAYDVAMRGRAYSLIGSVSDDLDPGDNLTLDPTVRVSSRYIFEVTDEETGRILGHSDQYPVDILKAARVAHSEVFKFKLEGVDYRLVRAQVIRTVDGGQRAGGVAHHVTALFAAPTQQVSEGLRQAVRFYALASFILLAITGCGMAWFLRYQLEPLHALADEAARVSTRQWKFAPPESARATRELAPLTLAIETTLARLQQSFEQQERFTSDAAHELKTGVAIAKSSLQLLAMRTRSVEEYKHGLEVCLKDCLRLEIIVQEMLSLARVQHASPVDVSRNQIVNLRDCARDATQKLATLAELRRVNVVLSERGGASACLNAEDAGLLCSNLLLNSLQHSAPDSEVRIEITDENGWLNMSIEDDGDGITPEILPHVFEPFFRGDPSRARHSGGTGLGLSICKAICDRAGGSIAVESSIGRGTRVIVRLPADAQLVTSFLNNEVKPHSAKSNSSRVKVEG